MSFIQNINIKQAIGVVAVAALLAGGAVFMSTRAGADTSVLDVDSIGVSAELPDLFSDSLTNSDIAELNPDAGLTRQIKAPTGDSNWYVVPGEKGACLATKSTMTCGNSNELAAGRVLSFSPPNLTPKKFSDDQMAVLNRGGRIPPPAGGPDLSGSTVQGLVPNDVVSVELTGPGGSVASAKVSDSVYQIDDVDMGAVSAITLTRSDGQVSTTKLGAS